MFIDGYNYSNFKNVNSKDGVFRFGNVLSSAMTASGTKAIYIRGTSLYFWNGSSESAIASSGSGVTTLDGLYDLDKSLTIDDTTLTFALTHTSNNGVTFTGGATATGNVIQITNSGTGNDINGTSSTWYATKAGTIYATQIMSPNIFSDPAGGNTALTIDASGSGTITLGGKSTGAITLTRATTISGAAASDCLTVTAGDAVLSDGSLFLVDADEATSFSVTNTFGSACTVAQIKASTAVAFTGTVLRLQGDTTTTGKVLDIDVGDGGLTTGMYISCNDDGVDDFSVGVDGATTITTAVNSTKALTVTGIQTSENMVLFDNASGAVASGYGVVKIDAGGAVASGGNVLRLAPTGALAEGSIGIEIAGAGKVLQGMKIDCDCADNSVVLINNGSAIASGKGVLELTNDGNLASGGTIFSIGLGGTPNSGAIVVDVDAQKNCQALKVDSDSSTYSAVLVTGQGPLASDKAMIEVTNTGGLSNGASLVYIHGAAAATATAYGLEIECEASNLEGLLVSAGKSVFTESATFSTGYQATAVIRIPNSDGAGTGTIADGTTFVTVEGTTNADQIIVLPTASTGSVVWLYCNSTGFELRTPTPASIAINSGSGTNAESAIPANTLIRMTCVSTTNWVGFAQYHNGSMFIVEKAAA